MQRFCRITRFVSLTIVLWAGAGAALAQDFLAEARDKPYLLAAIAAEAPEKPPAPGVTGITVPHHLIVPELIARGFWAASSGTYDRIILLSPDHYQSVRGAFATTIAPHPTVFGEVPADEDAARQLLVSPLFEPHSNAAREHGTGALMPFIAQFFPGVPVVTVVSSTRAGPEDWRRAAQLLGALVTPRTLIIQSTDYSHLLPLGRAVAHDQDSLNVIVAGDPEAVIQLRQADHLDSKASQYLQLRLQRDVFGARAIVLANGTSASLAGGSTTNVTSYITAAFHPDLAALSDRRYPDQDVIYVGGDTLLGRYISPLLGDARALAEVFNATHAVTRGAPLVLNLEGVLVKDFVANAPQGSHLMQAEVALPILRTLGVTALSLANNHADDFGPAARRDMAALLTATGIEALEHGEVRDLGALRVLGLNAVPGKGPILHAEANLGWVCALKARPPLIAMLHWGAEYTSDLGPDERRIAESLFRCGVSAVIGAHSHSPSPEIELVAARPVVFSTGNFLFDQSFQPTGGSLIEVRVFRGGTFALRVIPIGNLFNTARAAVGLRPNGAATRVFGPYHQSSGCVRCLK